MFRTLDLGRLFGIDLKVHATVPLLIGVFALINLASGGLGAALSVVLTLLAVALSVTLHELGHALTARQYGNPTHGITLYPFGGVARLDHEARSAQEEILVALAGPAVNVVLAGLALGVYLLVPSLPGALSFLYLNVILAAFNLLPAFPMDGGRVVRGGLWGVLGYSRATRVAARLGQAFAVGFGLLGLFGNPMLLVIAFFVYSHATQQLRHLERFGAREPRPHVDSRGRVYVEPQREGPSAFAPGATGGFGARGFGSRPAGPAWVAPPPSPRRPSGFPGRQVYVVWRR